MNKPILKEAIIVEGKYDKIKLDSILTANIIITYGFSIFKDPAKMLQIRLAAAKTGIVILTDSDAAGFKIRNYVKQSIKEGLVLEAYTPEIFGKEKRKSLPAKEGKLGVEGLNSDIILMSLRRAGCHFVGEKSENRPCANLTKSDLFMLGLSGSDKSALLREQICAKLSLPRKMSANALLDMLNLLFDSKEDFLSFLEQNFKS